MTSNHKKGVPPPSLKITSPCMNCEDRKIACHDNCDRYAEYRKKISEIRNAEFADMVTRRMRPTATQKKKGDRRWTRQ